jgi:aminoglycoside/choline kinase family phosphotransferase
MTIVDAIDIPQNLEDVSPEWLSAARAGERPGVRVASVRSESLHQGTASTWRLHLGYAAGSPPGPGTACIKSGFALPHAARLAQTGLYRKEAVVYLQVLPQARARVPACYAANYDDKGRGFMLMEDLVAAGGGFCNPVQALSVAQVAEGVEQLARLHAASWGDPTVYEPQWMHHGVPLSEEDPFWNALFDQYAEALETPHSGAMARIFRDPEVMRTAFNRLRAFDDPIACSLIHGDAHVGNFFVERNGDPGMADFQCVQRGHVTHDLATFMGSALDIIDRREHEQMLLRRYLAQLQRLGVAAPDFDEIWLGYRRHLLYALAVWLFTTDGYQPQLHLVTNIFRYSMAALDLDSLGAAL